MGICIDTAFFPVLLTVYLRYIYYRNAENLLFFDEKCSVIERNVATFDCPFEFCAEARRNLKMLREKIAEEFLSRYGLKPLARSDRILPYVQVIYF